MVALPNPTPGVDDADSDARQRRLVLWLLVIAYTLNFVDRTIIASIGQAIKADLKISDTQLGLLGGLYFALLYTILGLPLARLAERYSRVNIISAAIFVWSAFTALCGAAASYAQLAAYRFGVGVGEAGLSPQRAARLRRWALGGAALPDGEFRAAKGHGALRIKDDLVTSLPREHENCL